MEMNRPGRFVRSGKVKDIYELDDGHLLFRFTDRVSAYDVVLPTVIPRKGEVLCKLGAHLFETLGVPNHMIRLEGEDSMVVKKMDMIMVECVVRGYLYGSLMDRARTGEVSLPVETVLAAKLPEPYFDPTTKSDLKDEPMTEEEIVSQGRATPAELARIRRSSIQIYELIRSRAANAGFILADIKLEFGRHGSDILLGDSIGPDEFRMWPASKYEPGKAQESYDKQPIRDWLSAEGYKAKLDQARKAGAPTPPPPKLPEWLVEEMSRRYVAVFESLSGKKL
ncbi:MAG: phosphoribosylaminoimidazolesuccinocarboxamide synthase [Nitrososphaerales archaeon]|jgi:phosphoribosylaminoimidazole-succinocarboxamide synthase